MVNLVYADQFSDRAQEMPERVVLETGMIDSSTVEVGNFALVVYWQGERHPVSGEREIQAMTRGYILAVDRGALTLGMGGDSRSEVIALERIQTLVLLPSPGPTERMEDQNGDRDARKKIAGGVWGFFGGMAGIVVGSMYPIEDCPRCTNVNFGYERKWKILLGCGIGILVGAAIGVSLADSEDEMNSSLEGREEGGIVASISSEWSRKPPAARRFAIDLVPEAGGGVSAVATLRF